MAIANINFLKNSDGFEHNDRSQSDKEYFLPARYRLGNECDLSALEARIKLNSMINIAKDNYKIQTGQKFQGKVLTIEAEINLEHRHTLKDINIINNLLEERFGLRPVQSSIHRDEGHMEDDKPMYNLHAHVVYCNLDSNGKTILKNLSRADLSEIQDIIANTLQMERGQKVERLTSTEVKQIIKEVSVRGLEDNKTNFKLVKKELGLEKPTPAKHLHHTEYRAKKTKESEAKATKALKEQIAALREQLKAQGATRSDYAELEQLNKDLKAQIEAKSITEQQFKAKFIQFRREHEELTSEINAIVEPMLIEDGIDSTSKYSIKAIFNFLVKKIKELRSENKQLKDDNEYLYEIIKENDLNGNYEQKNDTSEASTKAKSQPRRNRKN